MPNALALLDRCREAFMHMKSKAEMHVDNPIAIPRQAPLQNMYPSGLSGTTIEAEESQRLLASD